MCKKISAYRAPGLAFDRQPQFAVVCLVRCRYVSQSFLCLLHFGFQVPFQTVIIPG